MSYTALTKHLTKCCTSFGPITTPEKQSVSGQESVHISFFGVSFFTSLCQTLVFWTFLSVFVAADNLSQYIRDVVLSKCLYLFSVACFLLKTVTCAWITPGSKSCHALGLQQPISAPLKIWNRFYSGACFSRCNQSQMQWTLLSSEEPAKIKEKIRLSFKVKQKLLLKVPLSVLSQMIKTLANLKSNFNVFSYLFKSDLFLYLQCYCEYVKSPEIRGKTPTDTWALKYQKDSLYWFCFVLLGCIFELITLASCVTSDL